MAFQYIMPTPVDMSDVFARFGQARQRRREEEQRRSEFLLKQEASNRDQARLDEQIRRQQASEDRQTGLDTANAIPKIKDMLTPGHPSYDPESGMSLARAYGINLSEQKPDAPAPPQRPAEREIPRMGVRGEVLPPDVTATRTELQPQDEARFQQWKRPDDGGGVDAISGGPIQPEIKANTARAEQFDRSMRDYRQRADAAGAMAPTYHGTSRIGPVDIDPNAAIATRKEQLRLQQERSAPLTGAANEQFRPVVQAMVAAGMPGSEIAKFISEQQKELHGDAQKSQYSVTASEQMRHNRAMEANGRLAAGDRGRAQNERSTEKLDETIVRDEQGNPIGYVPTGKGGAQGFATRDADYSRGEQMLTGLLDDLEKNGSRVVSPEAVKNRSTLYNNAVIGVATVSPLGKTDEAQKLERQSIGPSGAPDSHDMTGVLMGANPEAVRRKLEELRAQRARYRAQTLIPLDQRPGTVEQTGGRPAQRPRVEAKPKSNPIIESRSRPSLDDLAEEHGL